MYKLNDPVLVRTPLGYQVGIILATREIDKKLVYKVRLPNMQVELYPSQSLMAYFPRCPVCRQEMGISLDSRIEKHYHNSEMCYGSFTPYELRTA